jgi:hypothetical protein
MAFSTKDTKLTKCFLGALRVLRGSFSQPTPSIGFALGSVDIGIWTWEVTPSVR